MIRIAGNPKLELSVPEHGRIAQDRRITRTVQGKG